MSYRIYNENNLVTMDRLLNEKVPVDCVYGDMIYENNDFSWVIDSYSLLRSHGIFYVQLDHHLAAEMKLELDRVFGRDNFINWITTVQEWGGVPKKGFPKKTDFILMYSKGKDYKWYSERIQIEKATKGTAFDKKGTGLKTPCDCFYDLGNFSTMSKERVKDESGKNIRWQKNLKTTQRLLAPISDPGDLIYDPFLGSGTTGVWCIRNNRNFIGSELDEKVFDIASERLKTEYDELNKLSS